MSVQFGPAALAMTVMIGRLWRVETTCMPFVDSAIAGRTRASRSGERVARQPSDSARLRAFCRLQSYDPPVTHLAVSDAGWTAIGTLALALATFVAIAVTLLLAVTDRRRGDAQRLAEIERDDNRRADDRARDDERRAQDRERDDRLRRADAEERELREEAERRAREDYEARQVIVTVADKTVVPPSHAANLDFTITVSTPHAYPIKQVDGRWVLTDSGNFGSVDFGFGISKPTVDENRAYYTFRARLSPTVRDPEPIIRFVDWHGNLYYQYRHYTERFPQNTDFLEAAVKIDKWIRTGPKPD